MFSPGVNVPSSESRSEGLDLNKTPEPAQAFLELPEHRLGPVIEPTVGVAERDKRGVTFPIKKHLALIQEVSEGLHGPI